MYIYTGICKSSFWLGTLTVQVSPHKRFYPLFLQQLRWLFNSLDSLFVYFLYPDFLNEDIGPFGHVMYTGYWFMRKPQEFQREWSNVMRCMGGFIDFWTMEYIDIFRYG
ncbi:hypothetical protein RIR_jg39974.t1 [Rhizophagus irregularis DAOM 181602=DAOM 197198]|nr:hypothetical protein RIR_jg39974.t1 [Rhizophagus irregularis DAOM 181602=DAOM 197198]